MQYTSSAYVDMLKNVAEKYGLRFIDARAFFNFKKRRIDRIDTIVVHSYGVQRKQPFEAIKSWYAQKGVAAHIYVSTGKYAYLAITSDLDDLAQHVGADNTHTVGIEINEGLGNIITNEDNRILSEVIKVVKTALDSPSMRVVTHRDVTGKDCPFGYDLNQNFELIRR